MCVSSVTTKGTILSSGSVGDVRSHDMMMTHRFQNERKRRNPDVTIDPLRTSKLVPIISQVCSICKLSFQFLSDF